mmetsp:Transcript_63154/g.163944  ORF Transcript_63154/g.163944 Transcript_63154/m.163944 type:complete len:167 (-) Transcript_63154:2041-2541(-)
MSPLRSLSSSTRMVVSSSRTQAAVEMMAAGAPTGAREQARPQLWRDRPQRRLAWQAVGLWVAAAPVPVLAPWALALLPPPLLEGYARRATRAAAAAAAAAAVPLLGWESGALWGVSPRAQQRHRCGASCTCPLCRSLRVECLEGASASGSARLEYTAVLALALQAL